VFEADRSVCVPLQTVRNALERDIHTYVTEPDIMLVADRELLVAPGQSRCRHRPDSRAHLLPPPEGLGEQHAPHAGRRNPGGAHGGGPGPPAPRGKTFPTATHNHSISPPARPRQPVTRCHSRHLMRLDFLSVDATGASR